MTDAERDLSALRSHAGAVLIAFGPDLDKGTLPPRQHAALRALEDALRAAEPPSTSGATIASGWPPNDLVLPTPPHSAATIIGLDLAASDGESRPSIPNSIGAMIQNRHRRRFP